MRDAAQPPEPPRAAHSTRRIGLVMAGWGVAIGAGLMAFQMWYGQQENPNQRPVSRRSDGQAAVVELQANRSAHYVATGDINGQEVVFLVDTGATAVAVPEALARHLGLEQGAAIVLSTANGDAVGYRTQLATVGLGDIELRDVGAIIAPGMQGDAVLLGMTFLRRLELLQKEDKLILRIPR